MKSTELFQGWLCTVCGESGEGPRSDTAAARHTKTTQHPTRSWTTPKETR